VGDFLNLENVHEYIEFEDDIGGTTGFFPTDGLFGPGSWDSEKPNAPKPSVCDKSGSYNDADLRKAVSIVKNQVNTYHLIPVFANNCQTVMDRIRDRYRYIRHRRKIEQGKK